MTGASKRSALRAKLLLAGISVFLTLACIEGALQMYQHRLYRERERGKAKLGDVPLHVLSGNAVIYHLNPDNGEISSQGVRDREFSVPKPPGVFRVLVLGDSVAYASGIPQALTFPKRLEALLNRRDPGRFEVINAGVKGYTTYNELNFYLLEGRRFQPDLVILQFCLNDVVNPRYHWNYTRSVIPDVPDAAIPNLRHDRLFSRPLMALRDSPVALLRSLSARTYNSWVERHSRITDGPREWKVLLSSDDSTDIRVLADRQSPEWRWLGNQLTRLREATRADGAKLVVAAFPLSYQYEEGYPFFPQAALREYCSDNDLEFLDLFPVLRPRAGESLFLKDDDIWHLNPQGLELTAVALDQFLVERNLIPYADRGHRARPQ